MQASDKTQLMAFFCRLPLAVLAFCLATAAMLVPAANYNALQPSEQIVAAFLSE